MYTLSPKELEMMEIFWNTNAPLSRTEILEEAQKAHCTWKPNSLHILLNQLLEKEAVTVAGYYMHSRKMGRSFQAKITRQDYAVMQVALALRAAKDLAGMSEKAVLQALHRSRPLAG